MGGTWTGCPMIGPSASPRQAGTSQRGRTAPPPTVAKARSAVQEHLIAGRHITETVVAGLDIAECGKRHVIADKGHAVRRQHPQQLAPCCGGGGLVGVKAHL